MAAQGDGWEEALTSAPVRRYASAAAASWGSLSGVFAEATDPGRGVRSYVDRANQAALDTASYAEAGLMTALAERALTRVLVSRVQTPTRGLHELSIKAATASWERKRETPQLLGAAFLNEAIRSLTLHLVLRDGPQLVGGALGGTRAVQDFAWDIAGVAVKAAQPGHAVLEQSPIETAWPDAVSLAWAGARDFAVLSADAVKEFERSRPDS